MNDFAIYRSKAYGGMSENNAGSTFVRGFRSYSTSSDTHYGQFAGAATVSKSRAKCIESKLGRWRCLYELKRKG
jgi:hypothetical protein